MPLQVTYHWRTTFHLDWSLSRTSSIGPAALRSLVTGDFSEIGKFGVASVEVAMQS